MSIEAINEQLLRAIGVGVAILNVNDWRFNFYNDTFVEWFGTPESNAQINDLFPSLDIATVRSALGEKSRYTTEATFKLRRRTMSVAMDFNRAFEAGQDIVVLVCQNITRIKELESMIDSYSLMVENNTRELKREKEQVEKLLLNMMPRSVYEEYKTFGVVTPRVYEPVSVLALDFAGFSKTMVSTLDPGVIVSELNDIYSAFDRIGDQFRCERIKTIGDAYISVSGVPDPAPDHSQSAANVAIRFVRYLDRRNASHPIQWQCRIGIATGAVIGSVVGVQKYIYDVFGPAMTHALELRTEADPMTILTDETTAEHLGDAFSLTRAEPLPDNPGGAVYRMDSGAGAVTARGY